jgi:hypothetical protein
MANLDANAAQGKVASGKVASGKIAPGDTAQGKREWLFPVILGVLLAGSVISFAMAFVGRVAIPHQEVKISGDHNRASPGTASVERTRLP